MYLTRPFGNNTSATSPSAVFKSAAPTGDSSLIRPAAKSASVVPTIVYVFSAWSTPFTTSQQVIVISWMIFARRSFASISAISPSISACALRAASYSAFSERSPKPRAILISSAISARRTDLRYSKRASNSLRPASVN